MRIVTLGMALLPWVIGAAPLHAQGDCAAIPRGTALGFSVDRFYFDSEYHTHAVTFHLSLLDPAKLTPEFAVSLFPQGLAAGLIVTNLDVGGAVNLPFPYGTLLLRGGASGFVTLGVGVGSGVGAAAMPGAHYGASLLIKLDEKSAVRLDVLRRIYFLPHEFDPATLTIGLGITALPGIR
jgi:hypothetical protein